MKICKNKKCPHKRKLQSFNNFYNDISKKDKHSSYCKDCVKENVEKYSKTLKGKKIGKKSRKKYKKKYYQSLEGKFTTYKGAAKSRNMSFNLTLEQFETFWKKSCFYCGCEIETIGIDRVDNSKGYQMDNCVSCCEKCNKDKRSITVQMAQKIVEFKENQLIDNLC